LTNARVHTPPGTTVTLTLSTDVDTRSALIDVADDGAGIPTSHHQRVFERFYRADVVRAPETGGSGLGLAIVTAVTRAHGGTVGLVSKPGLTVFTVRLPWQQDPRDVLIAARVPPGFRADS
jgi:two-component system OmpR family sensor kinase